MEKVLGRHGSHVTSIEKTDYPSILPTVLSLQLKLLCVVDFYDPGLDFPADH